MMLEASMALEQVTFATADHKEATMSFKEKRKPKFGQGIVLPMDRRSSSPGDEVRTMLRDSLRGFLAAQWNAEAAAKPSASPEAIASIWTRLVGQGVAALGCDFSEGGLREILVVMTELGRAASCPAPMWSAALANLTLSDCQAEAAVDLLERLHDGTARVAFSFGALDPDGNAGTIQLVDGRASGLLRFVEVAGELHPPRRGYRAFRRCHRCIGWSRR